jgi:hypothetical protein
MSALSLSFILRPSFLYPVIVIELVNKLQANEAIPPFQSFRRDCFIPTWLKKEAEFAMTNVKQLTIKLSGGYLLLFIYHKMVGFAMMG